MKWLFFFLITLSATLITHVPGGRYFIVWNIGQGQWLTAVDGGTCQHFDMGGEFFPWKKIQMQCRKKENRARLSHWDWDHIGALDKTIAVRALGDFCLVELPLGKSSGRKMKMLKDYPLCHEQVVKTSAKEFWRWTPTKVIAGKKNSNDLSRVHRFADFLIPGDSTSAQEKTWSALPWMRGSRVLILGHHGSKTSTSQELLARLPNLKMAVSSARWSRYHHPHSDVEVRLRHAHVALLRTEDWGNIWFASK